MGIFSATLPPTTAMLATLAAFFLLYRNTRSAPWRSLAAPGAFSAWCFFIVTLPLLWSCEVPIAGGPTLHLFGMPLFVLMFGRRLAMTGIAISAIAYTALQDGPWINLGLNLLLLAVLPAWFGDIVLRTTRRFLPHHLFVYLLGNGLFGAMAMLAAIGMVSLAAYVVWTAAAPVALDIVAYMLLLAWGEAFLTGFLLTIFTVYRPEWVLTFDDEVYLQGK
jgi:uncharacterized membrane protein